MASKGQKEGRPRSLFHEVDDHDAADALERIIDRRDRAGDTGAFHLSSDLSLAAADQAARYVCRPKSHPSVDDLRDAAVLDAWIAWQMHLLQRKSDARLAAWADAVVRHPERPQFKAFAEEQYATSKQTLAARIARARAGLQRTTLNGSQTEAVRKEVNGRALQPSGANAEASGAVPAQAAPSTSTRDDAEARASLRAFHDAVASILRYRSALTDAVLDSDLDEMEELLVESIPVADPHSRVHRDLELHLRVLLASTESDPVTGVERPLLDSANTQVRALISQVREHLGMADLPRSIESLPDFAGSRQVGMAILQVQSLRAKGCVGQVRSQHSRFNC